HHDHGPTCDRPGAERTGCLELRFVCGVDPGALEDLHSLLAEDLGVGEDPSIDLEGAELSVIDDERRRHSGPWFQDNTWRCVLSSVVAPAGSLINSYDCRMVSSSAIAASSAGFKL